SRRLLPNSNIRHILGLSLEAQKQLVEARRDGTRKGERDAGDAEDRGRTNTGSRALAIESPERLRAGLACEKKCGGAEQGGDGDAVGCVHESDRARLARDGDCGREGEHADDSEDDREGRTAVAPAARDPGPWATALRKAFHRLQAAPSA